MHARLKMIPLCFFFITLPFLGYGASADHADEARIFLERQTESGKEALGKAAAESQCLSSADTSIAGKSFTAFIKGQSDLGALTQEALAFILRGKDQPRAERLFSLFRDANKPTAGQVQDIESLLGPLKGEKEALGKQATDLKEQLRRACAARVHNLSDVAALQRILEQQKEESEQTHQAQLCDLQRKQKEEMATATEALRLMTIEKESSGQKAAHFEDKNQKLSQERKEESRIIKEKLAQIRADFEQKIATAHEETTRLQRQAQNADATFKALQIDRDTLELDGQEKKAEHDLLREECDTLKKKATADNTEIKRLCAELQILKQSVQDQQKTIEEQNASRKKTQQELEASKRARTSLEGRIQDLLSQIEQEKKEHGHQTRAFSTREKKLQSQIDPLEEKVQRQDRLVAGYTKRESDLLKQIEPLKAEIKRLKDTVENRDMRQAARAMRDHKKSITSTDGLLARQEELDRATKRIKQLEEELGNFRRQGFKGLLPSTPPNTGKKAADTLRDAGKGLKRGSVRPGTHVPSLSHR